MTVIDSTETGLAQRIRTVIMAGRIGLGTAMMVSPTRATRLYLAPGMPELQRPTINDARGD